jgi:hypothetical protein
MRFACIAGKKHRSQRLADRCTRRTLRNWERAVEQISAISDPAVEACRQLAKSFNQFGELMKTIPVPTLFLLLVLVVLPFEYMPGLWTCPRGYVIRSGQCLADAEVVHGPVMEVSTVPSAGDGAPGTVCPSGGCSVLRDYNSTYVHVYQHRGWRWR